jgi:hypothetical protein
MKALVICPADRQAVAGLARKQPLVLVPFLGTPVLGHALASLAAAGAKEVRVLAADRPDEVRRYVGMGEAWGLKVEVAADRAEVTVAEARAAGPGPGASGWLPAPHDVWLLDRLPQFPAMPLWDSYADWHRALVEGMAQLGLGRVGMREMQPGVWVGLRTRVSQGARLEAPCWVGTQTLIGPEAVIGPGTVLEDGVYVDAGAQVTGSVVGPGTYVGAMTEVRCSLAWGRLLVNFATGSTTEVADAFLLGEVGRGRRGPGGSVLGRLAALVGLVAGSPLLAVAWLRNSGTGRPLLARHHGVVPGRATQDATFGYLELPVFQGWARRWPQLLNVVRGEMAWVGNRPLTPEQAATLESDFERLWLAAPAGVVSLADAEGCTEEFGDEAKVHAAFYAAQPGVGRDWTILRRALRQGSVGKRRV